MIKLQNNFTTPEQSKRLLELGVPADSADCYYNPRGLKRFRNEDWEQKSTFFEQIYLGIFPCWSVGRLMEIVDFCDIIGDGGWAKYTSYNDYVEYVIDTLTKMLHNKWIDFSKLEDYEKDY